ncbi:YdeI/OmpD-associated family protein [Solibacillus sp. CAU 1738]|uniref:YdeI/OmpD-associated family protein n=1 Tax=Solibacillus sp. CAU 1738 TaxID=3140363 RepID=UPI00326181A4
MEKKFKLQNDLQVYVYNATQDFKIVTNAMTGPYDRIIAFVYSIEELTSYLQKSIDEQLVKEQGYLFFVYPKKGNKKYEQFIHRDAIFPAIEVNDAKYIRGSDYKFASLQSLDETFSILAIKVDAKQKGKKKTAASQCVSDYENMVEPLKERLSTTEVANFYESLTPGYQKDWARYIYSAKREETQEKRFEEMIDILKKGFKTKELYRQHEKEQSK